MPTPDSRNQRRGEVLLESALVLLALLITLIGALDFGQLLFFHQSFRERVRAGVRYAVVHTYDPAQIRNMVVYNSTTAPPGEPPGPWATPLRTRDHTRLRTHYSEPFQCRKTLLALGFPSMAVR